MTTNSLKLPTIFNNFTKKTADSAQKVAASQELDNILFNSSYLNIENVFADVKAFDEFERSGYSRYFKQFTKFPAGVVGALVGLLASGFVSIAFMLAFDSSGLGSFLLTTLVSGVVLAPLSTVLTTVFDNCRQFEKLNARSRVAIKYFSSSRLLTKIFYAFEDLVESEPNNRVARQVFAIEWRNAAREVRKQNLLNENKAVQSKKTNESFVKPVENSGNNAVIMSNVPQPILVGQGNASVQDSVSIQDVVIGR